MARKVVLLVLALSALALPASAEGAFGVSKWEAGTCSVATCADSGSTSAFYTQAAGHPDFGITDFLFNFKESGLLVKAKEPEGHVKDVRVDLPVGLAVNPEATEKCSEAQVNELNCPAGSQVGVDEATGTASILGVKTTVVEQFPVYNVVRKTGQPARFAVLLKSTTLALVGLQGHLYLEGAISWHQEAATGENSGVASGDYHELFKIENIPTQPEVVESRLLFWGVPQQHQSAPTSPPATFLTLPSTCSSKPVTQLHVDSQESPGHWLHYENQTPVTATGCGSLASDPTLSLGAGSTQSDRPDAVTAALHIPQSTTEPGRPNSPDLKSAEVTLPEGLTLNPSAAHGLAGCTNAQIGLGTNQPITCPAASKIGTVAVNAPGIPNGSLTGSVFLGSPEPGKGPESGKEFRAFLAAEAPTYGVGLRLEGQVKANVATGRLTATFANTPQVPFEDFVLKFNGGARAPLANPLSCGPATPTAAITPWTGQAATGAKTSGFTIDSNGTGGKCAAPLPFSLSQSIAPPKPAQAGAYSPFVLKLARADGQQYASKITTTLPQGLLGEIPTVPRCAAAQASAGTCSSASQIANVTVTAGAGSEPFTFTGHAYLTGPYNGAPYGLSIVVPAVAGPYNLGKVITRATIGVGLYSGRVVVSATLPTVVEGVPLRLKSLTVAVEHKDFIFNPTSCGKLAVESLLGASFGGQQSLSSPFQVGGCDKLAFKPGITITSGAKISKADGAGLKVRIVQGAHQGNIGRVMLQLPKVLPSRDSTLQKACPQENFEAGAPPGSCPVTSQVGSATVTTPVLPDPLTGPAYLVSHGGAAFPDLDLVLRGDGLEVVLVGHTNISETGITTSDFDTLPDVPISSVVVDLPTGPNSVLAANEPLCGKGLKLPTLLVSQSGAKISRKTALTVSGCPFAILAHKVKAGKVLITLNVPSSGTVTVRGADPKPVKRKITKPGRVTIKIPLARGHRHAKLRITFTPPKGHGKTVTRKLKLKKR